ncbi:hypothetical protein ACQY0O_006597 [Thecaphora frezii]
MARSIKAQGRASNPRSESALSRRSSRTSFITAGGLSESQDRASSPSRDSTHVFSALHSGRGRVNSSSSSTDHHHRHHQVPVDVGNPSRRHDRTHQPDVDSSTSESPEPRFPRRRVSADSFHQSPLTSQDDAATLSTLESPAVPEPQGKTGRSKKHLAPAPHKRPNDDRSLLAPSLGPPNSSSRESDRFSRASHLTLPYERSETGDSRDDLDWRDRRASKLRPSESSGRLSVRRLEPPFADGPKGRSRSYTDGGRDDDGGSVRGGSRWSHLAPPLPRFQRRESSASSYAPSLEPSERRLRHNSALPSYRSPPSGRSPRKDRDGASSTVSRSTARGNGSALARAPHSPRADTVSDKVLAPESHVFPGTRIRKHIEPPLTDAMRGVLRQFSGRNLGDHRCHGYPIAVFVGATALDTGSVIHPHVSGGISLYFGAGHPKNMAIVLPDEDRIPRHIPNPKAPTPISLSRRAELRAAITALKTIFELYRGKVCAHICIDSAYVAKAWATWIPAWEDRGWPGDEDEEEVEERRRLEHKDRYRSEDGRFDDYDRKGRRRRDRRDGGYASEGGRSPRYEDDRRRRRRDDWDRDRRRDRSRDRRDNWLDDDPYDRRRDRRRGKGGSGGYSSERGSRRDGRGRRNDDDYYTSDSDDYSDYDDDDHRRSQRRGGSGSSRGSRRSGDGSRYDSDDYSDCDDDRRVPKRKPAPPPRKKESATSRKLVDEDLLRELADVRYEFAQVEMKRIGSAHLYLIDRTHNPADRMARAMAKSEGGLLGATVDHGVGSESADVDDRYAGEAATLHDDDYYDETRSMAEHRIASRSRARPAPPLPRQSFDAESRYSTIDERRNRHTSHQALASAARSRPVSEMPDCGARMMPIRGRNGGNYYYDNDDEEDGDDGAHSVATFRTNRRTPPSRAQMEKEDYLARQAQKGDADWGDGKQRQSRLAPPSSGRFLEAVGGSPRRSLDQRRFASSQPDLRQGASYEASIGRSSYDSRQPYQRGNDDDGLDRASVFSGSVMSGFDSGAAGVGAGNRGHGFRPPLAAASGRASIDSRRTFSRSRAAAPEEEGYNWDDSRSTASLGRRSLMSQRNKEARSPSHKQRQWVGQTRQDLERQQQQRQEARSSSEKKGGGLFGKLFRRR